MLGEGWERRLPQPTSQAVTEQIQGVNRSRTKPLICSRDQGVSLNNSLINRARLPAIDKVWELRLGADLTSCSRRPSPALPPRLSPTGRRPIKETPGLPDYQWIFTVPGRSGLAELCNLDLQLSSLTLPLSSCSAPFPLLPSPHWHNI